MSKKKSVFANLFRSSSGGCCGMKIIQEPTSQSGGCCDGKITEASKKKPEKKSAGGAE